MTLTFGAGIIFYNEIKNLQRLLPTLEKFEKVYCIDGRFPEYKYDDMTGRSNISDDGSREFIKAFSNCIIIDRPLSGEVEKRNTYLQAAAADNIDALLVIDADEFIEEMDWPMFIKECYTKMAKPGLFRVRLKNGATYDPLPRLVYPPKDFEYYILHYAFRYKPTGFYENAGHFARPEIRGIRIGHDDKFRTAMELGATVKYQNWLRDEEGGKLENHRAQAMKAIATEGSDMEDKIEVKMD